MVALTEIFKDIVLSDKHYAKANNSRVYLHTSNWSSDLSARNQQFNASASLQQSRGKCRKM